LTCTLRWPATAETEHLASGHLWSFGIPAEEFFAAAIALPGWAWALTGSAAPHDLSTTLEQV
jgi:hypothetical protein